MLNNRALFIADEFLLLACFCQVRMQFQGSKFDLEKREDERRMLQDLVGKNLTFLSQLDGLDFNLYSSIVLRRVSNDAAAALLHWANVMFITGLCLCALLWFEGY